MLNLKEVLAQDIRLGILAAQKEGKLPESKDETEIVVPIEHLARRKGERAPDNDVDETVSGTSSVSLDRETRGDYASPVAMSLAKQFNMKPMDILI